MRIRLPQTIEESLAFFNEQLSFPEIGQRALRCFNNTQLDINDVKRPKEKLSSEGYELGDKPFYYTTEDFRNITTWYVEKSMKEHNKNYVPIQLDDYVFETDEEQLLMKMAVDGAKANFTTIIEEMAEEMGITGRVDFDYYKKRVEGL